MMIKNLFSVLEVQKGQIVQIGQKIGKLATGKENTDKEILPLYFIVYREDRYGEYARKYLGFY